MDTKSGLAICAWYDNRTVLTISNFIGKEPPGEAKHWDKKKKEMISIARPPSVEIYNRFMRGIDKADMFLALYRTKLRTRKWYHRIAVHLLSLAVVNLYTIYKEVNRKGFLLMFLMDVCHSLCGTIDEEDSESSDDDPVGRRRSSSAKDVPEHIHYDRRNDWLLQQGEPQTCKCEGCT